MNIIIFGGGRVSLSDRRGEYRMIVTQLGSEEWEAKLEGFVTLDGMSIIGRGADELSASVALMEWADEAERELNEAENAGKPS